jgi:hypothetical protein
MIGALFTASAVAVMCWDNGGNHLLGLMIVRRADAHACFVDLPPELEQRLATFDRKFVEDNAERLLEIAYAKLGECEFDEDRVISPEFLKQGHNPAVAGTMRHIPAELVASMAPGMETWQAAGFIVDVGELDLTRLGVKKMVH